MAATWKIAWRNLGRNRRRTALTGSALAIGVALAVVSYGLTDGMMQNLLHALTRFDLGHVQIHHPDYPRSRRMADTIPDAPAVLARVRAAKHVRGAAPRVYAYALLSHGEHSQGAELVGVDPAQEPRVTVIHERVVAGSYLDAAPTPWPRGRALTDEERARDEALTAAAEAEVLAELDELAGDGDAGEVDEPAPAQPGPTTADLAEILSPPPERPPRILIGEALARSLRAEVGDRIHATAPTVDGGAEDVFFEVAGVFRTGTAAFDRGRVFMHIDDLRRFSHLYERTHEIAVAGDAPEDAAALAAELATPGALVRTWSEIRPNIQQMLSTSEASMVVMIFIIFFVATLGVVNTMLMAVFERTRELGVLKAIGMSARKVISLIVAETLLLVLAASAVGTLIGLGLDLYLVHEGLDLSSYTSGFSVGGVGISPVLYGAITARGLIAPTVILSATCLIASLYPAVRAARLRPAVGMRET